MKISIIVAVSENGVIGKDNQLLWKLSADLKQFKNLTTNHAIIMGRKTYDSIGRPLPNRTNIVISRNKNLTIEGCIVVHSLSEALEKCQEINNSASEVFIIGGEKIYDLAGVIANKIYLTLVKTKIDGDAYFDFKPFKLETNN
jgi:dihydrofolate reductase